MVMSVDGDTSTYQTKVCIYGAVSVHVPLFVYRLEAKERESEIEKETARSQYRKLLLSALFYSLC